MRVKALPRAKTMEAMRPILSIFVLALTVGAAAAQTAPGDAAAGERVFNTQCRACHRVGENPPAGVGPHLNGLFGRKAGSVAGFNYSPAFRQPPTVDKTWDEANFRVYIRNPREVTPGTRMVYAGLRDDAQIGNLIAYLRQFNATGQRSQ
jgi:cytochrome c